MSPQDFYVRGVEKALSRDYQGAIEDYTQAIALHPRFVEAYIKRGATRYKLGDDRGVLDDCNQALQLNPNLSQAYYYQGRSRYRLGYTQAAIEAYTQAIRLEPDYAQGYYHRGLGNHDLSDRPKAIEDLQKAATLFREHGDVAGYKLAQETLQALRKGRWGRFLGSGIFAGIKSVLDAAVKAFSTFILNPAGGLLPAFASLEKREAISVGIIFAIIADLCFVATIYLGWQDLLREASIITLLLVGFVPFVSLATGSAIARGIFRHSGSFAGDIFLAGASLLPLSFLIILSGISSVLPKNTMPVLTVFVSCYTVLTLYTGCTQISNLSEKAAAFMVPVILLVSGWLSYYAFSSMLL
ncbi:MAG: tetratricopeptide repeat protein [Coleofasciculus sp. S288]|nr:tetratricopeptide repeat protein [Coleofasciculus sp. S288]